MIRLTLWNTLAMVLAMSVVAPAMAAPKKSQADRNDEQREDQRVDAARKSVREAEESAKADQKAELEATKVVTEARRRHKLAAAELKSAREKQTATEEETRGVASLVAETKRHQTELDQLAEPLLKSLRSGTAYKAAQDKAKAALAELQKIRGTPAANEPDESGMPRGKSLLKTTLRPVEMEQAVLEANPAAQAVSKRLTAAQEKVAEARRQVEMAVENSGAVKQALAGLKAADREVEQAERQGDSARKKSATSTAKLARAQQDLARAVAADQADSNSGKKPNKK